MVGVEFLGQQTQTMATVQALRQRAQDSGYLRSDGEQQVYQQGPAITVQPVYPQYMYVRYYDPLVVYGPWWWPAYRPVFWRPWAPRVVFVNHVNIVSRQVFVTRAHVWSRPWRNVPESQRSPIIQGSPRPNATWRPVPEAQRQPIIQGAPRPQWRVEAPRPQWRAEARLERPVSLAAPSRSFQPRQQAFQQSQRQAQGGRRS